MATDAVGRGDEGSRRAAAPAEAKRGARPEIDGVDVLVGPVRDRHELQRRCVGHGIGEVLLGRTSHLANESGALSADSSTPRFHRANSLPGSIRSAAR